MKCEKCGADFAAGLDRCPRCGEQIHYAGKTDFYAKAVSSKLTIKDLFSDAFKNHPKGSGARIFVAGTPLSTPSPDRMLAEWDKPWLFTRVLGLGILFALLSYFLAQLGHPLGIYLLYTLCALVFPLGVLTFFWEINIPRDIPIYRVLITFFIGGLLSIIFTIILGAIDGPAYLVAPLTEEPGKVIAFAIFIYLFDIDYVFGGILIGAAVGSGFDSFENIYYAFINNSFQGLIVRSFHSFGTHAMWAAIEGGALVMSKSRGKLQLKNFTSTQFLMYLASSMVLHGLWDTDVLFGYIPLFGDIKYLLLIAAAIYIVFTLIKKAIAQVLETVDSAQFQRPVQPKKVHSELAPKRKATKAVLTAISGPLAGTVYSLQGYITIGRASSCDVVLPANTPGVSRRHCMLESRADGIYLMDLESSHGTFLQHGERIQANQWVRITGMFYLGDKSIAFSL